MLSLANINKVINIFRHARQQDLQEKIVFFRFCREHLKYRNATNLIMNFITAHNKIG